MDRQIINKRITGITNDIEKLLRTLRAMENTDLTEYPENYELFIHRCGTSCRAYYLPIKESDL